MDFSDYFLPIDPRIVDFASQEFRPMLGDVVAAHTEKGACPDLGEPGLVLMGVPEDRASVDNPGCALAPDHIRHYLYRLARPHADLRLVDLGNIAVGSSVAETYSAVSQVVEYVVGMGHTVILLGGGDDLVFPVYKAYEGLGQIINICSVDSQFNLEGGADINSRNFLQHIIVQQPNYLFDYANLGYQTYFVGVEMVNMMEDLKFSTRRLGEVQAAMEKAEPMVRYSDVVAIDVSAVRFSDAPGNAAPSPHGFYGEQVCQIARFAGMSDKTSTFMLTEMNPIHDNGGQTAHMLAHALWYFIEGYHYRLGDFPHRDAQSYKRFTAMLSEPSMELVFYKSLKSDRWWMEVPCDDPDRHTRYSRHTIVPCNYSDYERAMQNEIPDLWWHYFNRING